VFVNEFIDSRYILCFVNHCGQGQGTFDLLCIYTYWAPRWCLYFDVVVALAGSNDPESYAGGSIATGRVTQAGQVEGDDPD
jgi:hypothetical protein